MKTIGVTGANGFVGARLVRALLAANYKVHAFIRYRSPTHFDKELFEYGGNLKLVFGDIRDSKKVSDFIAEVDCCYHFAALVSVPYSFDAPDSFVATNTIGTLNVLEAIRKNPETRLVFASSSEVFGNSPSFPISEAGQLLPLSPYAASKVAAERLVFSYVKTYDEVDAFIIRPFNTYGPGQSTRAVIPVIIRQALKQDTITLGNIKPRRDFIFIDDLIEFYMLLLKSRITDEFVFNVGSGVDVSVGDIVSLISDILGKQLEIITDPERLRPNSAEVMRLLCDSAKAKEVFGWASNTRLEDGLRKTIEWVRHNPTDGTYAV